MTHRHGSCVFFIVQETFFVIFTNYLKIFQT